MSNSVTLLNPDQEKAAEEILRFLISDKKEFILSGAAGTGKTFLIEHVLNNTLKDYTKNAKILGLPILSYNTFFTATTNKAAKVLHQRIPQKLVVTIFSLLKLLVKENYKNGKEEISRANEYDTFDDDCSIIFIDECSMITEELYSFIKSDLLDKFEYIKIIYIGDKYQLAPVGNELSPIYLKNIPTFELLQPMRNNTEPSLINICNQYRKTVKTLDFKPFVENRPIICHLNQEDFLRGIHYHFVKNSTDSKILAYKNDTVNKYNSWVRSQLNYNPDYFEIGEVVVVNTPYEISFGRRFYAEQELTVINRSSKTFDKNILGISFDTLLYSFESENEKYSDVKQILNKDLYKKTLSKFAKDKNWYNYFLLKKNFLDIRPNYASTVHKSQGSTYDNVFIDLYDLSKHWDKDTVARLLYVAISRAKYRVYVYGDLPRVYGGMG